MRSPKHLVALGLVATAALAPAAASARDDDDIIAGDADSVATVFAADGTAERAPAPYGTRAFVARLVASGALGGSYSTDLSGDGREPLAPTPAGTADYDAPDGEHRTLSRSGFARPSTARYRRLAVDGPRRVMLRRLTVRHFTNADGERVEERSYAVDVATGRIRKVSIDAARRLSLDPRGGTPGTEYVYQVHVRP